MLKTTFGSKEDWNAFRTLEKGNYKRETKIVYPDQKIVNLMYKSCKMLNTE